MVTTLPAPLSGLHIHSSPFDPAHAQLFVGASLGRSDWRDFRCEGTTNCESRDTAGTVRFGYRYTPWLAVEGRYFDLGNATATSDSAFTGSNGAGTLVSHERFSARGLGLDAVLSWPISDRFAIAGIAGVARSEGKAHFSSEMVPADAQLSVPDVDGTKRATNPYYGLAAGFAVTPQLWLSLEAERYRIDFGGGDTSLDLLAAGITYRFR